MRRLLLAAERTFSTVATDAYVEVIIVGITS